MKKILIVAATGVLLLAGFFIAMSLYQNEQAKEIEAKAQQNMAQLDRAHSPRQGDPEAKVVIVEFFDPGCEACKAFHPFVKRLMDENPGKIQLVMRYAPFHKGSDYVAAILEAARAQNKFWETLEATYAAQDIWASHTNPQPKRLWMQLGSVGLDLEQIQKDMQNEQVINNINQDISDLKTLSVTKTPSFYVNGKPLIDFGYGQLRHLVESEVKKVY